MHALNFLCLCLIAVPSLVTAAIPQYYRNLVEYGEELAAGIPAYSYATGDNLRVSTDPQSFSGISDLVTLGRASTPLDLKTVRPTTPSSPRAKFDLSSVQTNEEFSSAFSVSAEIQGSYGGFSGSASASYAASKTLTSKSSLYFMFFEKQLGTMFLNYNAQLTKSALQLLQSNPVSFASLYGKYYIESLTLGCQASATVRITSKTEFEKTDVDAAAKASYGSMISGSAKFEAHMKSQKGFSALDVDIFVNGGDVPAAVSDLGDVKAKIVDPLDTGGKCTPQNAQITRVGIKSWLTLPAIAEQVAKYPEIVKALTPSQIVSSHTLARMNNVMLNARDLKSMSDKCHKNVFECVTKQWNEPTTTRQGLYQGAFDDLINLVSTLDSTTEETLYNLQAVSDFEKELEQIYQKWLKPAQQLTPFTFTFTIRVLNWYDDYKDPPPHGTNGLKATFTIDPNHEDTVNNKIYMTTKPTIDNGHSNCRHFYGRFYANFQNDVLSVYQWWNRVCGSQANTKPVEFFPGGDTKGSTEYDDAVRTIYSFDVKYGG